SLRTSSLASFILRLFFHVTPTTDIYTLSLHYALPISAGCNQTRSRPFSRFDVHRLELERLKKSRRELTRLKAGVVENLPMKRDRRLNAFDHELIERADHLSYGELARASSHDQLGDHRVVVLRDSVSRVRVRIHANAGSSRRMERRDDAG